MSAYGIGPYGTGTYGGITPDLSIVNAVAISTHEVRVTFTKEPQNILPILPGDVQNIAVWSLVRGDTGLGFNILEITKNSDLEWDVRVLETFGSSNVSHTISALSLLDTGGSPIDAPRVASFPGVLSAALSTPDRRTASHHQAIRDFNNPPAPTGFNSLSGTLVVSSDGDYQLHEGPELVRKLIFRRLTTLRGAFWHLPNYGTGLRVKEPVAPSALVGIKAEIERQVKLEPEVEAVSVRVSQSGNALNVLINARLSPTGQQVSFPLQVPFGVAL